MFYSLFPLAGTQVQRVISPELQRFYMRQLNQLLALPADSPRFPGANPVSMMRRDLEEMRNTPSIPWLVAEKSDGLRFLLVLTVSPQNEPVALLLDRSCGIYLLPGAVFATGLFFGGTVLDVELVSEAPAEAEAQLLGARPTLWVLLAFDLLASCGRSLRGESFTERYTLLEELVATGYKPQLGVDVCLLRLKEFYPLAQLSYLCSAVLPQLRHATDGLIIMQGSARYKPGMQKTILKWKERQKHTIDFLCHLHKTVEAGRLWMFGIYVQDSEESPVLANYMLVSRAELTQLGLREAVELELCIVECAWSDTDGWRPLKLRHDKAEANSEYTLRKTCENIEEDIRLEELLELVTRKPPAGTEHISITLSDDLSAILSE
jgi:hypothetical protein